MCGNILGGQAQEKRMEPGKDKLKVGYDRIKYGAGYWILDKKTLNVLETVRTGDTKTKLPSQKVTPEAFVKVKRTMKDSGKSPPFIR